MRIALGYKKLAYEPVFVNLLAGEQKKPEYLAKNPIGHVPTLAIDGVTYVESVAIMELLEELYPDPPLLPKTPQDRARVRALVETINAGIQPLQNLIVLDRIGGDDKEKRSAWLKHFITRGLARIRGARRPRRGPFAFGATFTMADACLVPQIYAPARFGVDLAPFPRIVRADAAARELAVRRRREARSAARRQTLRIARHPLHSAGRA